MLALVSWHLDLIESHELPTSELWAYCMGEFCSDARFVYWNGSDSVAIYVGF
jgi:hypothetical protein